MGHKVVGIMTYPKTEHEKDTLEHEYETVEGLYESVFEFAETNLIQIFEANNLNHKEPLEWLKEKDPDLVISWRNKTILNNVFLDMFKKKIINIHIGKLPKYRGSGAMSWMILNGEKKSAVTVHYIDEKIDTGNIISQIEFSIPENSYPIDIYKIASRIINSNVPKIVESWSDTKEKSIPQQESEASYYPRLNTATDGELSFDFSPLEFCRFVRAFGWPYLGAFFPHKGRKFHIGEAKIPTNSDKTFHAFMNGLVISQDDKNGSITVVTGRKTVEIISIRKGNSKIKANELLKPGTRLVQRSR